MLIYQQQNIVMEQSYLQPKGTMRRIRVFGEVTNFLAYRNENDECFILADNKTDFLPEQQEFIIQINHFFGIKLPIHLLRK